jgi:hypothetical protein
MPFVSDTTRPPHPAPNVRDDRDTPLKWDGIAADIGVIWVRREPNYFCKVDWTTQISLIRRENFLSIVTADSHAAGHRTTSDGLYFEFRSGLI